MDWEKLGHIASVFEALVVGISVIFIWYQLRQQTRLAKIANTQTLVDLSSPFNLQLIQDRQLAEFWIHGAQKFDTYDAVDQYRYKSVLIWWLILHENIFFQKENGMLDESIYSSWLSDLTLFVHQQRLGERWDDLKGAFQPKFAEHVSALIERSTTLKSAERR